MLLVALLTVERSKLDDFRQYEYRAAKIMARYGGQIERAIVLPGPASPAPAKASKSAIADELSEVLDEWDREFDAIGAPIDDVVQNDIDDAFGGLVGDDNAAKSAARSSSHGSTDPSAASPFRIAPTPTGTICEMHVISFPDEAAFAAYRADSQLALLAPMRAGCVLATEVFRAEDGPRY